MALHPPWSDRVDELLEKPFMEFSITNSFISLGEKKRKKFELEKQQSSRGAGSGPVKLGQQCFFKYKED